MSFVSIKQAPADPRPMPASVSWQPIATAAREPYKPIDLWVVPGKPFGRMDRGKPRRIANAHSSGNGKYWLEKGRYIEGRTFYDDEGEECFDPDDRGPDATIVTHWMPVPERPMPASADAEGAT